MEEVLQDVDRRLGRIEQILRTLATKEELRQEVARLATKEELRQEVARLATKEELRQEVARLATKEELRQEVARLATKEELLAEGERTRAHFNAVAERLEAQLRILAEAVLSLTRQFDEFKAETNAKFAEMDLRLAQLEAR